MSSDYHIKTRTFKTLRFDDGKKHENSQYFLIKYSYSNYFNKKYKPLFKMTSQFMKKDPF